MESAILWPLEKVPTEQRICQIFPGEGGEKGSTLDKVLWRQKLPHWSYMKPVHPQNQTQDISLIWSSMQDGVQARVEKEGGVFNHTQQWPPFRAGCSGIAARGDYWPAYKLARCVILAWERGCWTKKNGLWSDSEEFLFRFLGHQKYHEGNENHYEPGDYNDSDTQTRGCMVYGVPLRKDLSTVFPSVSFFPFPLIFIKEKKWQSVKITNRDKTVTMCIHASLHSQTMFSCSI